MLVQLYTQLVHTEIIHKNLLSLVTNATDMPLHHSGKIGLLCQTVAEKNPQVSLVYLLDVL